MVDKKENKVDKNENEPKIRWTKRGK